MVNKLLYKGIGESEKCVFCFCLETERMFWPIQYDVLCRKSVWGRVELQWQLPVHTF